MDGAGAVQLLGGGGAWQRPDLCLGDWGDRAAGGPAGPAPPRGFGKLCWDWGRGRGVARAESSGWGLRLWGGTALGKKGRF